MPLFSKKISKFKQRNLYIVYTMILAWMGFVAWPFVGQLNLLSISIILCFGYIICRFVFELTFNRSTVPTMATCYVARQKIAKILQHEVSLQKKLTYTIVDLGSGRGELARCLGKKIPKAKIIGIEIARFPYIQSVLVQRLFGPQNVTFDRLDFWNFNCASIDAVVLYLGPMSAQKIGNKLRQELKPGSIVISHTYALCGEWKPIETQEFHSPFKETFFVYKR